MAYQGLECMCSHWSKRAGRDSCHCVFVAASKIPRHMGKLNSNWMNQMLTVCLESVWNMLNCLCWQTLLSFYFLYLMLPQVTGERYCRAQQEAHHAAHTYLCLLSSTRNHLILHNVYHGKGECSSEEAAGLVGLRLPKQPGGKGWEKWGHESTNLFRVDFYVVPNLSFYNPSNINNLCLQCIMAPFLSRTYRNNRGRNFGLSSILKFNKLCK